MIGKRMSWQKLLQSASLGALIVATVAPAQAQTVSSGNLSDFSYTLVDLDLNDNITPVLTLRNELVFVEASVYSADWDLLDTNQIDENGAVSYTSNGSIALAAFDGTSMSGSVTVGGAAQVPRLYGEGGVRWTFDLTANSMAIFTANASGFGTRTSDVVADGFAGLFAYYRASPGSTHSFYRDNLLAVDGPASRSLALSISSGADQITNGGLSVYAGGDAEFLASAVPEPESYAMLLAGLAMVGGLAKRRRRTNAAK